MNCNFHKSQNEMFCIGQKICLSNISYLHKATECHGYEEQMKKLKSMAAKTVNYSYYAKALMTHRVLCRNSCASGWHIIYSLICEINTDSCERLCKTTVFTKMAQK